MNTMSTRFLGRPRTKLGWWSVGLGVSFIVLFILVSNGFIHFSGILTMALGVLAGIVNLIALIGNHERSWMVWLMLLPGLFAIVFALGEILSPH